MSWFNTFKRRWKGKGQSNPTDTIGAVWRSTEEYAAELAHRASLERAKAIACAKEIKELWLSECEQISTANSLTLNQHRDNLAAITKATPIRSSWTHRSDVARG
jgi:hypothetical protein